MLFMFYTAVSNGDAQLCKCIIPHSIASCEHLLRTHTALPLQRHDRRLITNMDGGEQTILRVKET